MRTFRPFVRAVLLLSLSGCAAYGASAEVDAGNPLTPVDDAGIAEFGDAETATDAGGGARGTEADFASDGSSCLDFVDNDGNGVLDCDEPSCQSRSVNQACCVGSTSALCCNATATTTLESATCSGVPCLQLDGATLPTTLGQVFATAELPATCDVPAANAFAPVGSTASHGFLVLPRHVDAATTHLSIAGRLGVADDTDTRTAAAGFGLFTEQGIGAIARPLVALVASVTSDQVRVVVGDRVVASVELGSDPCARSDFFRLDTTPDGTFRVFRRAPGPTTWEPVADVAGDYEPAPDARVALFGQQTNPDPGPRAWVSDLSITENGCDRLAPARSSTAIVGAGADHDVDGLTVFPRDTSSGRYEALVTSGDQIYWMAVQSDRGGLVSRSPSDPFADNIQPTWDGVRHVRDVEVLLHAGAHRVFLATSDNDEGRFSISETTYTIGATTSTPGALGTPRVLLAPSDFGADAVSVDSPTALLVSRLARLVLVVRVRYADGHSEIRVTPDLPDTADFESAPAVQGRSADGVTTDGLVRASQSLTDGAFDRDEVADPELVEIDGVVRVLYAGRRGTRWSLGSVVASVDFHRFAPVGALPIVAPSGTGFDGLGVTEPAFVRRDGVDWLYYAGSDGARRGIGLAVQPVVGGTP